MHTSTFARLSFAAAALAVVGISSPAHAQRAIASNVVRTAVQPVAEDAAILRTVAIYQFEASRTTGMPNQVTLADSLGKLFATFTLPGNRTEQPMMVDVTESDIVLQGQTPAGIVTLMLYQRSDAALTPLRGKWFLGERQGELLGRGAR